MIQMHQRKKQVRRLSEVQSADLTPGSILPVLERTIRTYEPLAKKQKIDFHVYVEKDLPTINIDEHQMVTAFSNIIENALESMNANGELTR